MNDKILITGAGGAAAIALIQALHGTGPKIFAADMDPVAQGLFLVSPDRRIVLPAGSSDEFVPALLTHCSRLGIDVLVPTVDVELLPIAQEWARFAVAGVMPLLSPRAALEVCLDKHTLMQVAREVVPVPKSTLYDEAFDVREWIFPLVVKPRRGSGGRGVRIVRDPRELDGAPADGSLLVQELLAGPEYSVDVLVEQSGRARAAVPRERIKTDSGVAVVARTLRDPELESLASTLSEAIGLRYAVNVQFKRDAAGTPRLLEVNPRFPGTIPLTIQSGVDMPTLAIEHATDRLHDTTWIDFREVAMVRTWHEVYLPPEDLPGVGAAAERPASEVTSVDLVAGCPTGAIS